MKHKIHNKLGQIVGEYDDVTKVYFTIRDKRKGEIFIKKRWFDKKYMHLPIAVDASILNKLISRGLKTIRVLILGDKPHSYVVSFDSKWILENGVNIDYDRIKQGRNITHFSSQIVWDGTKGITGADQTTLK